MKSECVSNLFSIFHILLFMLIFISQLNACDVMGARACGQKPDKEDQESDPIKYCIASRVYFECVHKKYHGCENKEKYQTAMESILKGIRKRVDELLGFCSSKIEDYKFNINWDSPKQASAADSIRNGGTYSQSGSSKANGQGAPSSQGLGANDLCQVKTINELCQPLAITSKFNPSWNNVNKRVWCQQGTTYFRCLKSRLDKCPSEEILDHFQNIEHYLRTQININCPGGVDGCTRHSTDARCKIGLSQSNSSSSTFCLFYFFVQSVLQILLLL